MKTISSNNIQYEFNSSFAAVQTVEPGETVCFKTLDCYTEQIDVDNKDYRELNTTKINPVTGPLYVNSAQKGDVLKVEILDIAVEDHGIMYVRANSCAYEIEGNHCRYFSINGNMVHFDNGIKIPVKPMIGVIGTCPEIPSNTITPGEHGGNMDIKDIGIGSIVYLPVEVEGALLSIGDCHAVQGDGETATCAMEVNASVTVRVDVLKNRQDIPTPFIETKDYVVTTFADKSLDAAGVGASQKMHKYLMSKTNLTDAQASMLLSLVGELRISQVVNPKKGCIMQLDKKYCK